jgi:hypothetical protein
MTTNDNSIYYDSQPVHQHVNNISASNQQINTAISTLPIVNRKHDHCQSHVHGNYQLHLHPSHETTHLHTEPTHQTADLHMEPTNQTPTLHTEQQSTTTSTTTTSNDNNDDADNDNDSNDNNDNNKDINNYNDTSMGVHSSCMGLLLVCGESCAPTGATRQPWSHKGPDPLSRAVAGLALAREPFDNIRCAFFSARS